MSFPSVAVNIVVVLLVATPLAAQSPQQTVTQQTVAPRQTTAPQQFAAPATAPPETIAIGQSLDDAMDILRGRGIEFGENGFSFAMTDQDLSHLHFTLDPNHTSVALFYSKSRRTVTGLSMFFIPSRLNGAKSKQSQVSAQAIFLYPDGTYAVRFTKPLTLDELKEREARLPKHEYPPANFSGPDSSVEPRLTPSPSLPRN